MKYSKKIIQAMKKNKEAGKDSICTVFVLRVDAQNKHLLDQTCRKKLYDQMDEVVKNRAVDENKECP